MVLSPTYPMYISDVRFMHFNDHVAPCTGADSMNQCETDPHCVAGGLIRIELLGRRILCIMPNGSIYVITVQ